MEKDGTKAADWAAYAVAIIIALGIYIAAIGLVLLLTACEPQAVPVNGDPLPIELEGGPQWVFENGCNEVCSDQWVLR